jgi:hypothetical protein
MHVARGSGAAWYIYFGGGERIRGAKARTATGRYSAQPVLLGPQGWFSSAKGSPDGSHELWAPAVFPVGDHYVMYFAAWNAQQQRRCLGIAVGDDPLGEFHLARTEPICAPRAADAGTTKASAIDPSFYRNSAGQRFMLFQAGVRNRVNVAIWSYRMQQNGIGFASPSPHVVLRAAGPGLGSSIENPQMIKHDGRLFMFVSANFWHGCRYHTDVYAARRNGPFRRTDTPIRLLSRANTRLCGPGGASVTNDGAKIFFTAWKLQRSGPPPGLRAAYTGNLRWSRRGPSR